MPIYEYRCKDCGRKTTVFLRSISSDTGKVTCDNCEGGNLIRLFSRVAIVKAEGSYDDMTDPATWNIDDQDPRSIARLMRNMQKEGGEDLGEEFEEIVGKMEQGEMPEELADAGGTEGQWDE